MSQPIEEYGFISNTVTGALIDRNGSMDWLCLPYFDSDACFAALLGDPRHGRWQLAPPVDQVVEVTRRYRPGTTILETTFRTTTGTVTLIDFMPFTDDEHCVEVVRLVRGDAGRVTLNMELILRFGYGQIVPWVHRSDQGLNLVAGPDAVLLRTPVALQSESLRTMASFSVGAGAVIPFCLGYRPSHRPPLPAQDRQRQLQETAERWSAWSSRCEFGPLGNDHWREAVLRSLITLKALTFQPTGGIIAAPTTSLPEHPGGVRNWDYRLCWIRDATLTLYALLTWGYRDEADSWRQWLMRAAAGDPAQLQVIYGLFGERRLSEFTLPGLPGYAGSLPVRVGNAAFAQRQLDVPGELMDALHVARRYSLDPDDGAWRFQCALLRQLAGNWQKPDAGIWEVRGGPRHFTYSRLMCWVAFDRGIKGVESYGLSGPVEEWRMVRDAIRADIEQHGWHENKRAFVQYYGGAMLDASLLLMAQVGFLQPDDPRFRHTVEAIERELVVDGLVLRYRTDETPDGLPGDEGVFLACSFWLADAYILLDRYEDAVALFRRLLALRNDLGLLAEEYDPRSQRLWGNFPQAFSHVALINTARNLVSARGPARQRAGNNAH